MKTIEEIKRQYGEECELRFIPGTITRTDGEGGYVSGYGAVFNSWSPNYYYFREMIAPGAFDDVDMSDVVVTFNHNFDNVLARTKNGSATLEVDDTGLMYRYQTPNTSVGKDVEELVRIQTVAGSSFMFTVKEEVWRDNEDGTYDRTITKVGSLYELGPVVTPWYPDTTADVKAIMRRAGITDKPKFDKRIFYLDLASK